MAQWYITLKNNIIQEAYHTSQGVEAVTLNIDHDYDEIRAMPENFEGYKGLHINELNEDNRTVKPLVQRIQEGYRELPEGYEIVDNQLSKIPEPEPEVDPEIAEYNLLVSQTLINMAKEYLGGALEEPMSQEEYDLMILNALREMAENKIEEDYISSIEG